jgi:lysophospholipase L1-like esterase
MTWFYRLDSQRAAVDFSAATSRYGGAVQQRKRHLGRHRGGARTLAVVAAMVAVAGCGAARQRADGRLAVDDIGRVSGCAGYGHSYVAGAGLSSAQTFLALVCRRYGQRPLNDGVGGSSLQSQLLTTLRQLPADASRQLSIVMWGINDLGAFGPSLGGYRAALRLLASRLRTDPAGIHSFHDPALSYSGPWTDSTGEKVTTSRSSFTWTSSGSFAGGSIAFMMTIHRAAGATYGFTVDGRSAGTFVTRRLSPPSPAPAVSIPVAYRVTVPSGRHVVRCRVTRVQRGANLVGYLVEARSVPLVVLVQQPRLPSYRAYRVINAPFVPSDRGVRSLNRAIADVAAEFDSYVVTVNADRVLDRDRAFFQADDLHPNALGDRRIAAAIEQQIDRNRHVSLS